MGANFLHQNGPCRTIFGFDLRFRHVVDNESLLRKARDQFERGRQLFGIDENVVGEIELTQTRDSPDEIFANQEAIVWFVLDDVTESAQLPKLREKLHALRSLRRTQINPANDSGDARILFGELQ